MRKLASLITLLAACSLVVAKKISLVRKPLTKHGLETMRANLMKEDNKFLESYVNQEIPMKDFMNT